MIFNVLGEKFKIVPDIKIFKVPNVWSVMKGMGCSDQLPTFVLR